VDLERLIASEMCMQRRSQRAIHVLSVLAAIAGPGRTVTAEDPAKLNAAFTRAYQAQNWKKAIEAGHKLVELSPRGGLHQYNLACCYAMSGEKAGALEWLEKAADAGFSDDGLMAKDKDFESIRQDDSFQKQLARVRENATREAADRKAGNAIIEIVVPEGHDATKAAPAILALHGQGGRAANMIEAWKGVAGEFGAILIAPQAVQKAGGGWDWGYLLDAEFAVLAALEKAAELHKIDEKRVVLTGFSQGGMISYDLAFKHPRRFRGVIPVAAGYHESLAPRPGAAKAGYPRFFIMVGSKDANLGPNRTAAKQLQAIGAEHTLNVYEGVGHAFPKERDAELRKAMKYALE
jgi:phospholipase/carboxylesterase